MKILSIVWYKVLPPIYGGQKGIALFNEHLGRLIPISCLCAKSNAGYDVSYKVLPLLPETKSQFISPASWNLIRKIAVKEKPSHVILEHPYHGIAAVRAARHTGAKLIVHSHNIESERFRRLGKPGWKVLARYERWVHQQADLNLFKTETDLQYAIDKFQIDAERCMVVPYGIDEKLEEYAKHNDHQSGNSELIRQRHDIPSTKKILLFAGTLDYLPNAKAVEAIYSEIAPRLRAMKFDFSIIICGRNKTEGFEHLQKLKDPDIIMLSEVADMAEYFQAADAFINPVSSGGGIQTKVIEAVSNHCNVVGFEQMLDKAICDNARVKLYSVKRDNWQQFAEKTISASSQLQITPPEFFQHYSWQRITRMVAGRIGRL